MAFYVAQSRIGRQLKMGYARDGRVTERVSEHETAAGEFVLLATVHGADKSFESKMFARFRNHQAQATSVARKRPYEVFRPSDEIFRFLRSSEARKMGFEQCHQPLREPRTATEWLEIVALFDCPAAKHNLAEQKRLRAAVPKDARGGWVLWEFMCGSIAETAASQSRQLLIGDWAVTSGGVEDGDMGFPVHVVNVYGKTFRFAVFREAYERAGLPPHPRAVHGAVPAPHRRPSAPRHRVPRFVMPPQQHPAQRSLF